MSRRGRWTRRPRRSPRRPVRRAPRAARHSGLPVSWCREPPFRSYAAQLPGRSRFEPQFLQIRAQRVEAVSPHKRGSPRAALARKAEADPQLELVRVFTDPAAEVAPRRGERPFGQLDLPEHAPWLGRPRLQRPSAARVPRGFVPAQAVHRIDRTLERLVAGEGEGSEDGEPDRRDRSDAGYSRP